MKVLLLHNRYQHAGGEDDAFDFEAALLKEIGYEVHRLVVCNKDIRTAYDKAAAAWSLPWNARGYAITKDAIARVKPDIMHVHNFFALLSPSIYDAAAAANVPVVQTLHNFRITCANALLLRNGSPCELCITGTPYNAARFGCYRNSRIESLALARMIAVHRRRKTWLTKVALFVALSHFARSKFISAGLPVDKIVVKPNGAPDYGLRRDGPGEAALYVGRLSEEKGVRTLIDAAFHTSRSIRIAGDGPLRAELASAAPPNVTFLGRLTHPEVLAEMVQARCLVIPSMCYENSPRVLCEAYSVSLPVIASNLGSLGELVEHGVTGFHVTSGDAVGFALAIDQLSRDSKVAAQMGEAARREYEIRYSPAILSSSLDAIYRRVLDPSRSAETGKLHR